MEIGRERRRITARELRQSEDWQLTFPGSVVLSRDEYDEGEGHGFDLLVKSAYIREYRLVDADPSSVLNWFDDQLKARGWRWTGNFGDRAQGAIYGRHEGGPPAEAFCIIIRRPVPPEDAQFISLPPGSEKPGTIYDISYEMPAEALGAPSA